MNPVVETAKQFIVSRILDQAQMDGVALSEVEKRMLPFAEGFASAEDLETAANFEREYDGRRYEAKIAELIQKVYERDVERGAKAEWDGALDDLADEDIYLHVMLEKAGLVKTTRHFVLPDWRLLWGLVPILISVALAILAAFSSWAAKLIPNNLLRLGICIVLLAAPLLLNKLKSKGNVRFPAPRS